MKSARNDFRNARRIVDLGRPFRHRAEHRAVIEFLECLALAHVARYLAYEHDQRRRILHGDVNAGRSIARARPTGDEANARPPCCLAHGLRHHRRSALLTADGERDVAVVERIESCEVALARHAEGMPHAMRDQLIDEDFAAGP